MTHKPKHLKECDHPNATNAVWVSRATWLCPDCKKDISLLYVLLMKANKEE